MQLGAEISKEGVRYAIWAPDVSELTVEIQPSAGTSLRHLPLTRTAEGWHHGLDSKGLISDAYGFCFPDGRVRPDPRSRRQQDSVHGHSMVVDPGTYQWRDATWVRPRFRDLIIYEIHIGTFTAAGTYLAAREKLGYLERLGVTAIEIMPVADFPGSRNWGYDGVLIYAPARCYGPPDDLRALVDAAHLHGIAVILDVVYNHLGPDGNYLSEFSSRYFSKQHQTPWDDGFNFDGEEAREVRRFFVENPAYWMEEFHFDGFRFDATHEIVDDSDVHVLAEMTSSIHQRNGYAIAEDNRNLAGLLRTDGFGFDAVWADDFHHTVRTGQTGEQFCYYQDFSGETEELVDTLIHGWHYRGQKSEFLGKKRGTSCRDLPPERFVHFLCNHDQTGNRAAGERINHIVSPQAFRALSMFLCLSPYTPHIFMGQEWGATTPFLFFTDHHAALGREVTRGRQSEFSEFPEFSDPRSVPDPQSVDSFLHSKLKWSETTSLAARETQALYRECLALRREQPMFRPTERAGWSVTRPVDEADVVCLTGEAFVLFVNLRGRSTVCRGEASELILSSEETRFAGSGGLLSQSRGDLLAFDGPEARLFSRNGNKGTL